MKTERFTNKPKPGEVVLCAMPMCKNQTPPPRKHHGMQVYRGVCDECIGKLQRKHGIK